MQKYILFNYILEKSLYYTLRPGLNIKQLAKMKMLSFGLLIHHDFWTGHHLKLKLKKLFSINKVFVFIGEFVLCVNTSWA